MANVNTKYTRRKHKTPKPSICEQIKRIINQPLKTAIKRNAISIIYLKSIKRRYRKTKGYKVKQPFVKPKLAFFHHVKDCSSDQSAKNYSCCVK